MVMLEAGRREQDILLRTGNEDTILQLLARTKSIRIGSGNNAG